MFLKHRIYFLFCFGSAVIDVYYMCIYTLNPESVTK